MTDQPCYSVLFITMAIESVTHDATMGLRKQSCGDGRAVEWYNYISKQAQLPQAMEAVVRRGINKVSRVVVVEEGYKRRCC